MLRSVKGTPVEVREEKVFNSIGLVVHWECAMDAETLRELALELLDDEHGISSDAWNVLYSALVEAGHNDIIQAVDGCDGRVYLSEGHGLV